MNDKKKLKVGIYLRLSNEDIDKDIESESIKNQRNMLIQYIKKHQEFVLVGEYSDEDLSGAGTYRPEFERLITDCEERKLDIVLCKSQSRFSRDMEIVEKYINNKFKEWNIRFIGLTDNADTSVLGNKKARQINGLVNEWYLEDVSNNIRSAFKSKMMQGEFISPFAPFGYEINPNDNNKLVVDPVASLVVKRIYNLYLKGLGFMGIAKYLNDNEIPSPSLYKYQKGCKLNVISHRKREEIKWSAAAIKTILKNEVYLGHLIQGKRTTVSYKNHKIINKNKGEWVKYLNAHESIVDENTFNDVQIAMKERTRTTRITGMIHMFSGKVFCLECKHCMRKKNSKFHEYLVCSNNRDGYTNCENKYGIRYDELKVLVLNEINKVVKKYYDLKELERIDSQSINRKFSDMIKNLENQKKERQNKISKISYYLQNLYEDKVNGVITLEQFKDLITCYNKERNTLNNQIKNISLEIDNYKMIEKDYKKKKEIFNKYKEFKDLNGIIVQEFIDKIYIGNINKNEKVRNIEIKWRY